MEAYHIRRRIATTVVAVAAVFTGGTVGFHHLLHEQWHNAFYRTVVTTTLTGLDSTPRGPGAELLTILLALSGVAIFGYLAAQAVEAVAREVTGHARREKRRHRMIEELRDHFIICGFGRVGRKAADEFVASGQPFVVLDFSADALAAAEERGVRFHLEGRGAEDEDLGPRRDRPREGPARLGRLRLGKRLHHALGPRAPPGPDDRRPRLRRPSEAERKLGLAGANRVVQPYSSAGTEMAKLALKPQVAAFLDIVSSHAGPDMRFEEIEVHGDCGQAGRSIRELRIRKQTGAMIVALRKPDGSFDTTPNPDVRIEVGDVLIAIGTEPELQALEEMFARRDGVGA